VWLANDDINDDAKLLLDESTYSDHEAYELSTTENAIERQALQGELDAFGIRWKGLDAASMRLYRPGM
jgi:hypothetical protein